MNKKHVLSAVACVSLFLATGALAEIQGVQPGTSANPKDNVPKEIKREGGNFGPGGSGPGRRSDELVGMKKEMPQPITENKLIRMSKRLKGAVRLWLLKSLGLRGDLLKTPRPLRRKRLNNIGLLSAVEVFACSVTSEILLGQSIGEAVFVPRWGINPFGQLSSAGQSDRITWSGFSGQLGAAYAQTDDNKTILKASFSKYQERLLGWHFNFGVPTGQASFPIHWWDLNGNQVPDLAGVDRYAQANSASPVALQGTTWHQNIDPDLKTPYMREFRLGIERELGGFNVGVAGVYRSRHNQISALLYDLN